MGIRNFRIDGVSCAGKTTLGRELARRGYRVIHGDDELAGWSGSGPDREWVWDEDRTRALAAETTDAVAFFIGGSRNSARFAGIFESTFVLEIDDATLARRLAARPKTEWGGTPEEGEAFAWRQQSTREGLAADGVGIDGTAPLAAVVKAVLDRIG